MRDLFPAIEPYEDGLLDVGDGNVLHWETIGAPVACGPDADLSTNTTDHLVADMERLREHLGIDRWVVVGVSWGATLGLVYAQRHTEHVRGLVLGPVTAGTRRETTWITRDMHRVFPEQWEEFVAAIPAAERDDDLAAAYARLLASPDSTVREEAGFTGRGQPAASSSSRTPATGAATSAASS